MKERVVKFVRENYKILIPILLMVVLFIAVLIFYKFSVLDNSKINTEGEFYQYFYGNKYEYKGVVTTNRRGHIIGFSTDDYDINFDSTPIYYKGTEKVIFPKNMSVVMPTLNCAEYLSSGYSYLEVVKGSYNLDTTNYHDKLGHYFLYDGTDLYFFLDEVNLKIGSNEIKLSPMSYVVAKYGKEISYYDKKSDTYKSIEINNDNVKISNDYYSLFVMIDQIDYYGTKVTLTGGISNLNTIDMKG